MASSVVAARRRWTEFLRREREGTGLPLGTILLVAMIAHGSAAVVTLNPIQVDEHFQILEFAHARLGLSDTVDLAWEFEAQIRPALQPIIAMSLLAVLHAVGVFDPFVWGLALRGFAGLCAIAVSLRVIALVSPTLARPGRRILWLSSLLLWCGPWLHTRFSAENMGGIALAAGILAFQGVMSSQPRRGTVAAGLLLALAFVFRYQTAFSILALTAWGVWLYPGRRARILGVIVGGGIVMAASVALDAWFYGNLVITPWRYFQVNLMEGVAAEFGTAPWFSYAWWTPLTLAPPLGLVLFGGCVYGACVRPRSPWSWAAIAFFVGHSLVAHKEMRFLASLVYVLPVLMAYAADRLAGLWTNRLARAGVGLLVAQNALLLLLTISPLPHRGREMDAHFFRFLYEAAEHRPLVLIHTGDHPFTVWSVRTNVFTHPDLRTMRLDDITDLADVEAEVGAAERLLLVRLPGDPSPPEGITIGDAVYVAEAGYAGFIRAFGLEETRWVNALLRVDGWAEGAVTRRVYEATLQVDSARSGGGLR